MVQSRSAVRSGIVKDALFSIGQIVTVEETKIRAVVFEVDDCFRGSAKWFQEMQLDENLKSSPWYQLLLENGDQLVYMPEVNLKKTTDLSPLKNSSVNDYFSNFQDGRYVRVSH